MIIGTYDIRFSTAFFTYPGQLTQGKFQIVEQCSIRPGRTTDFQVCIDVQIDKDCQFLP